MECAILSSTLQHYQEQVKQHGGTLEIHSLLKSDLGAQLPLHISLSRPVVLTTDEKSTFSEVFENALQNANVTT